MMWKEKNQAISENSVANLCAQNPSENEETTRNTIGGLGALQGHHVGKSFFVLISALIYFRLIKYSSIDR